MKYKASRDLLEFARENKTLSPSRLANIVLNRRNKEITPEAVTHWFKRHPTIYEELRKEIIKGLPTEKEKVDDSIFERKQFAELLSIRAWILEMKARELKELTILQQVSDLRLVCRGIFPHQNINLVSEGKWCFKHPDRLNLQDALEIIAILKDKKIDSNRFKRALKDFLTSKDIVVGKKIVVGKLRSFGKLAKLYVERSILNQMLEWIKKQDFEAYVCHDFMFKTGTRKTATLKALIENVDFQQHTIKVYDKARNSLYPEGKEWEKYISSELWQNLKKLIGKRKVGRIFSIDKQRLGNFNREALKRFLPDLEPKIRKPNHFWRHMFFQHMLRATDWNYALCSELGGSTVSSLQESYGKPPKEIVRQWGLKYMPTLETSEKITPIPIIREGRMRK
jgi:hypothetical protein